MKHWNILFDNEEEFDTALAILRRPIKVGKPLRRRTVVLAGHVGGAFGHGEFAGRRSIWFIEDAVDTEETWNLIVEALAPLKPRITDDSGEAQKFLGRA